MLLMAVSGRRSADFADGNAVRRVGDTARMGTLVDRELRAAETSEREEPL